MTKTNRGGLAPLRNGEFIAGLLFLPCYFGMTDLALRAVLKLLGRSPAEQTYSLLLLTVNFLIAAVIFHHLLFRSLQYAFRNFWNFLQAVILAVVFFFAVYYALTWSLGKLDILPKNLNNSSILALYEKNVPVTTLCICVLAPITEECLFRALIFGSIHRKSRVLAYIVSVLLFALIHTLPYLLSAGNREAYLLNEFLPATLLYLPAGIALAWAYEKSGTIWASILSHALINFIVTFVTITI